MDFRNGIPVVPQGTGPAQNWFCGGRVGVAVGAHGGITRITYYGRQHLGGAELFHADPVSAWAKLFRLCVLVDGTPWHPEFRRTELLPCGYRSRAMVDGVAIEHELVLLNDAIVQRVRVLKNPRRRRLALRLVTHGGAVRTGGPFRTWTGFAPLGDSGAVACTAVDAVPEAHYRAKMAAKDAALTQRASFGTHDVTDACTVVAVGGEGEVSVSDLHHGFKWHVDGQPLRREGCLFTVFGWDAAQVEARVAVLRRHAGTEADAALAAARSWPQVRTADPALGSYLGQLPAVVDALRVADIPGGMRAAAGHYWVWGWDSMVYSKGLLLAGHTAFVEEMLAFHQGLAHPELGIPHCMTTTLVPTMAMAFTAQCLYGVMLANHQAATGDLAVLRRHYPFARRIIAQALAREVRDTGLVDGPSLFPDFPELVGHDGHDLSVFNNSIYYQALRLMAGLARIMAAQGEAGEAGFADQLDAAAERCRTGFRAAFFDEEAGYFIDSVSTRDGSRRMAHPGYAILWVSGFAADLVRDDLPRIARFMERRLAHERGVWHYPPEEGSAWLSDGNQGQASYPVIEPFYRNVMSLAGRRAGLDGWAESVSWFWRQHTVPEGLTFDARNAADLTPDCPGGKQPFSGKAWYELFFTAYAGIDLDLEGLRLRPTPVRDPIVITGMRVGRAAVDVRISGSGSRLAATLNGRRIDPAAPIPRRALRRGRNRLVIRRIGQ